MRKKTFLLSNLVMMLLATSLSYANTPIMHTVKSGETYYSISKNYDTQIDDLLTINNTTSNQLYEGDLLTVDSVDKTISVYVNDEKLETDVNPYLENDRTHIPIRFISEALGYNVQWDDGNKRAIIKSDDMEIILPIGSDTATVNGVDYTLDSTIQIYNDRTFIPVRFVSEKLGCSVNWDGTNYSVIIEQTEETISQSSSYSSEDLYWLSRIVEAEAKGETYAGKLAVANIVINRAKHDEFPNTIKGVIFDTQYGVQFSPTANGTIYNTPSEESTNASIAALEGNNNVSDCLYFLNPSKLSYSWIMSSREKFAAIGNHDFYF